MFGNISNVTTYYVLVNDVVVGRFLTLVVTVVSFTVSACGRTSTVGILKSISQFYGLTVK